MLLQLYSTTPSLWRETPMLPRVCPSCLSADTITATPPAGEPCELTAIGVVASLKLGSLLVSVMDGNECTSSGLSFVPCMPDLICAQG